MESFVSSCPVKDACVYSSLSSSYVLSKGDLVHEISMDLLRVIRNLDFQIT